MTNIRNYLTKINSSSQISWFEYFILFFIIFMCFYYGLASYALENMNEGLYAEIPREMMLMHSYAIPHLNFVPYLEKPPFLYWLIVLSYHLFGISAFSARLVPVTAAAITCLSLFVFAKKVNLAKEGWIAAIVLATSVGFVLIGRVIIFDMVLTAVFSLSLIFFYLWYVNDKKYYLWLSYLFLGLAFMTKGMLSLALIPAIAILFMLLNKTPQKKIFKLIDIVGIIVLLATTVPWVIVATIQQHNFAWDFFINEQVLRFLNKRIPHDYHTGRIYYYVIPLIVSMMPWSFTFPFFFKKNKYSETESKALKKFLWLWFLLPFIFFSISEAKAQYYIVIGYPALALLLGIKLNEIFKLKNARALAIIFRILAIVGIVFTGLGCLTLYNSHIANALPDNWLMPAELAFPLLVTFITLIIYGVVGLTIGYLYRDIPIIQFLLIAGIIIPGIFFLLADKHSLQPERSAISIGEYIINHDNKRPVYLYQEYENISSILFYAKKRIAIIDSVSQDLYFGSGTPAAKGWFVSHQEFANAAKKIPVYVVLFSEKIPEFNSLIAPLKFCNATQSGDISLLSNVNSDCRKANQQIILPHLYRRSVG